MIVDVSGLDMFKELQKTLKPVDVDTSNLPRYAKNDKVGIKSDAINYNPNYISDEELYKRMWHNINEYENVVP